MNEYLKAFITFAVIIFGAGGFYHVAKSKFKEFNARFDKQDKFNEKQEKVNEKLNDKVNNVELKLTQSINDIKTLLIEVHTLVKNK